MVKLGVSSQEDIERIQKWTDADPYHQGQRNPEWWLTGTGFLSFRLDDDSGPLVYVKVVKEDSRYRIHCQFAPQEEVSKSRLARGLVQSVPVVMKYLSEQGGSAAVFNTISDSLGVFLMSQGFVPEDNCEYVLHFQGE
jgi:hypothetical protein